MSTKNPLPTAEHVANCLTGLVGKKTTVKAGAAVAPGPNTPTVVALFNRDNGEAAGAWVCDIPFSARVGASLTMIPNGAAEDCAKSGKLTEAIYDNVREVLNVAANLFNADGAPHTKLVSVHAFPPDALPEQLKMILAKPGGSSHLEVNVDGYGVGRASIHVT